MLPSGVTGRLIPAAVSVGEGRAEELPSFTGVVVADCRARFSAIGPNGVSCSARLFTCHAMGWYGIFCESSSESVEELRLPAAFIGEKPPVLSYGEAAIIIIIGGALVVLVDSAGGFGVKGFPARVETEARRRL